jgi:hypothetical protein
MIGCNKISDPLNTLTKPVQGEIVYSNSFESDSDTIGWQGFGTFEFRPDAPIEGGNRSLFVSGGCPVPHASVELDTLREDCSLIIHCYGKNLAIGGLVALALCQDELKEIAITINDSNWNKYSSDTLFCAANQSVKLSLSSGGIVSSSMLVDLIEIIKIK